jgi:hypothetical protein
MKIFTKQDLEKGLSEKNNLREMLTYILEVVPGNVLDMKLNFLTVNIAKVGILKMLEILKVFK